MAVKCRFLGNVIVWLLLKRGADRDAFTPDNNTLLELTNGVWFKVLGETEDIIAILKGDKEAQKKADIIITEGYPVDDW